MKNPERFKCLNYDTARARVQDRDDGSGSDIDPLLVAAVYTLDKNPKPQELSDKLRARRARLAEQYQRFQARLKRAGGGPSVPAGGKTEIIRLQDGLPFELHWSGGETLSIAYLEKLIAGDASLERLVAGDCLSPEERACVFRADEEQLAYEAGQHAGEFAYSYRYDAQRAERRSHLCRGGNFYAQWGIRVCRQRWITGYVENWRAACRADGAKHIPRGFDPEEPQPLPEFNPFLRKALALSLKNTHASHAKRSRPSEQRKHALKNKFRECYPNGGTRDRAVAADAFYAELSPEDQALWKKPGDSDDKAEERAIADLQRALIGVKFCVNFASVRVKNRGIPGET